MQNLVSDGWAVPDADPAVAALDQQLTWAQNAIAQLVDAGKAAIDREIETAKSDIGQQAQGVVADLANQIQLPAISSGRQANAAHAIISRRTSAGQAAVQVQSAQAAAAIDAASEAAKGKIDREAGAGRAGIQQVATANPLPLARAQTASDELDQQAAAAKSTIDRHAQAAKGALGGQASDAKATIDRHANSLRASVDLTASTGRWSTWHSLGLVALVAGIAALGLLMPPNFSLETWLGILVLLAAAAAVVGLGISGRVAGILIDDRNMMSLSRLQLTLWTILILSAYLAAALANLSRVIFNLPPPISDPLGVAIPQTLWALMGISTTSLVGSPLIKSTKSSAPDLDEHQATRTVDALQRRHPQHLRPGWKGRLVVNVTPRDASLADMLRGEETGNAASIDLGKVQMFYFTFALLLGYMVALGATFNIHSPVTGLPDLSPSMLALLAISHAGYLSYKAVPHSDPSGLVSRSTPGG